jgi:hypothetical protein
MACGFRLFPRRNQAPMIFMPQFDLSFTMSGSSAWLCWHPERIKAVPQHCSGFVCGLDVSGRYRIKSMSAAGSAIAQAFDAEPSAPDRSVGEQGIAHIVRTGRLKPARLPDKGRQGELIGPVRAAYRRPIEPPAHRLRFGHHLVRIGLRHGSNLRRHDPHRNRAVDSSD